MTALTVNDTTALVTRTIDQAKSKDLMVRELVQNAIEATKNQISGEKKIIIRITDPAWFGLGGNYYSSKKFGIWNTGTGMSASELEKATNLASSIGKTQGIHDNFGEGAKVSALPVNKSGMIWVSCHNKEVNMVVLRRGEDPATGEERYERQDFPAGHGKTSDVTNITHLFNDPLSISNTFGDTEKNPSNLTVDKDWTYIVLCGNDPQQDTTLNPYGDDATNTKGGWVINEIYKRFSSVPDDVEILSEIHSKGKDNKTVTFQTFFKKLDLMCENKSDKVKKETVSVNVADSTDIKISYIYDGPWKGENLSNSKKPATTIGNPATCGIFSAIIYNNEFYDVRGGGNNIGNSTWQGPAKECGIHYGYQYFRIFVEIPNSKKIITDRYRTELQKHNSSKTKVLFTDFKFDIYANMPTWFKDIMKTYAPAPIGLDSLQKELQELMEQVNLQTSATTDINDITETTAINKNKTGNNKPGGYSTGTTKGTSTGATLVPSVSGNQIVTPKFPDIVVLYKKDIEEASVDPYFIHKAAEYAIETNTLFINGTYKVVAAIANWLLEQHGPTDSEYIKNIANSCASKLVIKLVGSGLVYGLSKKGQLGYENDFEKAIDSVCLTTHADRWFDSREEVKRDFKNEVKLLDLP